MARAQEWACKSDRVGPEDLLLIIISIIIIIICSPWYYYYTFKNPQVTVVFILFFFFIIHLIIFFPRRNTTLGSFSLDNNNSVGAIPMLVPSSLLPHRRYLPIPLLTPYRLYLPTRCLLPKPRSLPSALRGLDAKNDNSTPPPTSIHILLKSNAISTYARCDV